MDPVTALGLGCNVLQLIKDTASTGRIIYKICKTGRVEGIDDFDKSLQDFDKLIDVSKKLFSQHSSNAQIESARQLVSQTLQTCSADAKLLRDELQKLKSLHRGIRRLGFAFRAAFTASAAKVSEASSRLDRSRDRLSASFLPVVVSHVQHMLSRQEITCSDLSKASQDMLQLMGTRFDAIDDSLRNLEDTVVDHIDTTQKQTAAACHSEQASARLLASLSYNDMNDRLSSISTHSESTFDWILDPTCENARGSFSSWLVGPESHFWIRGKAGSGKSTLMKKLWSDDYLVQLLALHDEEAPVRILKHSFWLSTSNNLRKNYKGMLCALTYDILSTSFAAVEWLFTERPAIRNFKSCSDWDEAFLESTLFALLEDHLLYQRTCIFLDALDEVGSAFDKRKILKMMQRLLLPQARHIKICTSSRPERPWIDSFRSTPQLRLEELTYNDIQAYARKELEHELPAENTTEPTEIDRFFSDFAHKSEGVFLWAYLAVQSLLNISAHGSWLEVQDLLAQLPSDMMQLYNNILSRRARDTDSVKTEAATYLQLCLWSNRLSRRFEIYGDGIWLHHALLVWRSYFNHEESYHWEADAAKCNYHCTAINERILDICAGLLRPRVHSSLLQCPSSADRQNSTPRLHCCEGIQQTDFWLSELTATRFVFFHRTAADFLSDTPEGRKFLGRCAMNLFDILLLRIDAEILRCRLFHKKPSSFHTFGFQTVALELVDSILAFKRSHSERNGDAKLILAMQKLIEAFSIVDSKHCHRGRPYTKAVASWTIFEFARCYDPYRRSITSAGKSFIAHDITGLFLEFGMSDWFNIKQVQCLESTTVSVRRMTSVYKDYLLVCAVKGNLPTVAESLINCGADFYAEMYLPLFAPQKRSAAAELLKLILDTHASILDHEVRQWEAIVARCQPRKQHLLVSHAWHSTGNASSVCPVSFHFEPDYLDPYILVLDIHENLSLWLQHAPAAHSYLLPTVAGKDCVGLVLMGNGQTLRHSVQPFFANSWSGFSTQGAPSDEVRSLRLLRTPLTRSLAARCPKCLADAGDGFWRSLQLLTPLKVTHSYNKLRGCIESSGLSESGSLCTVFWTSAWNENLPDRSQEFAAVLAERDFNASPTDPRVAQAPLVMYERIASSSSPNPSNNDWQAVK